MENLMMLDLDDNRRLTGTVPSELGRLTNLRVFRSVGSDYTGTMPVELCRLRQSNLTDLAVCGRSQARFMCGCCTSCIGLRN